jgi:hypothetical protein
MCAICPAHLIPSLYYINEVIIQYELHDFWVNLYFAQNDISAETARP